MDEDAGTLQMQGSTAIQPTPTRARQCSARFLTDAVGDDHPEAVLVRGSAEGGVRAYLVLGEDGPSLDPHGDSVPAEGQYQVGVGVRGLGAHDGRPGCPEGFGKERDRFVIAAGHGAQCGRRSVFVNSRTQDTPPLSC
ncbi:MAG TPA: hypothetical protein PKB06_05335 [Actinotalea sp.]|nr:hypothetical protein [Actinotalea sp.]